MHEASTQSAIRNGIEAAHAARGAAFRAMLSAIFNPGKEKDPRPASGQGPHVQGCCA